MVLKARACVLSANVTRYNVHSGSAGLPGGTLEVFQALSEFHRAYQQHFSPRIRLKPTFIVACLPSCPLALRQRSGTDCVIAGDHVGFPAPLGANIIHLNFWQECTLYTVI